MPFHIIRDNIARVHADAIVNTANPEPVYAGGTDSAIYHAAGRDRLLAERKKIGRINPGQAAFTPAFALHAKYIIHTVGPVWQGGDRGEFELLASCYRNALGIARRLGCESIAFPLISTGVYGFPKDRALEIALREISVFLEKSEMDVTLVVFDRKSFDLSAGLAADIRQYINENYVTEQTAEEYAIDDQYFGQSLNQTLRPAAFSKSQRRSARHSRLESPSRKSDAKDSAPQGEKPDYLLREEGAAYEPDQSVSSAPSRPRPQRSLQDVMSQVGESFQECLLRLIDQRGLTDAQVYKRANIDRKLFSKIRSQKNYRPSKQTAISFALALELTLDETRDLLLKAGYALSHSSKADIIVEYFIMHRIYDKFLVNEALYEFDQPIL